MIELKQATPDETLAFHDIYVGTFTQDQIASGGYQREEDAIAYARKIFALFDSFPSGTFIAFFGLVFPFLFSEIFMLRIRSFNPFFSMFNMIRNLSVSVAKPDPVGNSQTIDPAGINYSLVQLNTARLNLRPLAACDADELFSFHSDPEFMRYWAQRTWTSIDQANDDIAREIVAMAANNRYMGLGVFLRENNRLIGVCNLRGIDRQHLHAQLGFGIAKDYWRKGFMSEAVSAIIQFSFDELKLRRLEADIDPRNIASCKLAEKLGFVFEGIQREKWYDVDEITSEATYSLLSREWRNPVGK